MDGVLTKQILGAGLLHQRRSRPVRESSARAGQIRGQPGSRAMDLAGGQENG